MFAPCNGFGLILPCPTETFEVLLVKFSSRRHCGFKSSRGKISRYCRRAVLESNKPYIRIIRTYDRPGPTTRYKRNISRMRFVGFLSLGRCFLCNERFSRTFINILCNVILFGQTVIFFSLSNVTL